MSFEVKNFVDYFSICGLDIKSGLEPELNEAYGKYCNFNSSIMKKKIRKYSLFYLLNIKIMEFQTHH